MEWGRSNRVSLKTLVYLGLDGEGELTLLLGPS